MSAANIFPLSKEMDERPDWLVAKSILMENLFPFVNNNSPWKIFYKPKFIIKNTQINCVDAFEKFACSREITMFTSLIRIPRNSPAQDLVKLYKTR
jgi:hypothetical protein